MSTRPDDPESLRYDQTASVSEIEAVAERLIVLVEEFELAMRDGHVPCEFAERLSHLRQSAERLAEA